MGIRHDKFRAYWESLGKPALECCDPQIENWTKIPDNAAFIWAGDSEYRISGDPHWKLRLEWVNSDFTLPIEQFIPSDEYVDARWARVYSPKWLPELTLRKADTAKSDWLIHIPGNPMPVSATEEVEYKCRGGHTGCRIADLLDWGRYPDASGREIIEYRVKDVLPPPLEIPSADIEDWRKRHGISEELQANELGVNHPMYAVFMDAIEQATGGKGQRHGGARSPFLEQPWHQIAKHTGFRGLVFQAVKKAQEACGKDDYEAFEREMLGSLVYSAMALIHVRKYGYTREVKVDGSK